MRSLALQQGSAIAQYPDLLPFEFLAMFCRSSKAAFTRVETRNKETSQTSYQPARVLLGTFARRPQGLLDSPLASV